MLMLFSGPSRVGKTTFALELVKLLNCLNPTEEGSCDRCENCRLIINLTHPDISFLFPSGDYLKIDEIRSFVRWLNFKPLMGKMKVGIIEEAEKLTEEAANCLLKTLEEPPGESMVILITSQQASSFTHYNFSLSSGGVSPLSSSEISNYLVEKKGWKEEEPGEHLPFPRVAWEKRKKIKEGRSGLEDKFWELWYKLKSERDSLSLGSWFYDNKELAASDYDFFRAVFERFVGVEGSGGVNALICFLKRKSTGRSERTRSRNLEEVNNFSG